MKFIKYFLAYLLIIGTTNVFSHQFTPTYPTMENSYVDDVLQVSMELFNKRDDVEHYQIDVFDKEWKHVPFAIQNRLIVVKYLESKKIVVYIRKTDRYRVTYICSSSKIKRKNETTALVVSRICSKIK